MHRASRFLSIPPLRNRNLQRHRRAAVQKFPNICVMKEAGGKVEKVEDLNGKADVNFTILRRRRTYDRLHEKGRKGARNQRGV